MTADLTTKLTDFGLSRVLGKAAEAAGAVLELWQGCGEERTPAAAVRSLKRSVTRQFNIGSWVAPEVVH